VTGKSISTEKRSGQNSVEEKTEGRVVNVEVTGQERKHALVERTRTGQERGRGDHGYLR